jgi:hypothetical protein
MACKAKVTSLPSSMKLTTLIDSPLGKCRVPQRGARHAHLAENRTLFTYHIAVHCECETSYIRYDGLAASPEKTWDASFWVSARPGSGGRSQSCVTKDLTNQGTATAELVRVDVTWTEYDWPPSPPEDVYLHLQTV